MKTKLFQYFDLAYMGAWFMLLIHFVIFAAATLGCFPQESHGQEIITDLQQIRQDAAKCDNKKPFRTGAARGQAPYICQCEKHRKERRQKEVQKEKKRYQLEQVERKTRERTDPQLLHSSRLPQLGNKGTTWKTYQP